MIRSAALVCAAGLAACSAEPDPPANAVTVEVPPRPGPVTAVPDAPLAPGELPSPELDGARPIAGGWEVRGDAALFGEPGAEALFAIRCDRASGKITLMRSGARGTTIRIVAASGAATYPARIADGAMEAEASAEDRFIADALVRARGRIAVQVDDGDALAIPADPAIGRIVRRCREPG